MFITAHTEQNDIINRSDDESLCDMYIIVSQTGTILSRIIKLITRAKYNHVSLSLENDLSTMYSFGRVNPYNPVLGGFVIESPKTGTFARFTETEVVILRITITNEQKNKIKNRLEAMYRRRKMYHYNYLGLFLAALHIHYQKRNCYYCSEFVREILVNSRILKSDFFDKIVHPMKFLKLEEADVVYQGKLRSFAIN